MNDDPIAFLERVLNDAETGRDAYEPAEWPEVVAAMQAVLERPRTVARDALLVRVFAPGADLQMAPSPHGPHAMPPRDALRFLALQRLSKEEIEQVRPHLERIAAAPEHAGPLRLESARRLRH